MINSAMDLIFYEKNYRITISNSSWKQKKGRLMGAEKLNRTHKNATKPDMQFLEFKLEFLELVLQFQELEQYSVLQGKRLV